MHYFKYDAMCNSALVSCSIRLFSCFTTGNLLMHKVILFITSLLVMKQRDALIYVRCMNYNSMEGYPVYPCDRCKRNRVLESDTVSTSPNLLTELCSQPESRFFVFVFQRPIKQML